MRSAARLLFRLTGVPLRISGLDNRPGDRACVMISNHASYLDGVALVAVLPGPFSFVAKRELGEQFVPRVFLRRIGTLFVERFDMQRGLSDARQTRESVKAGRSVLFFPEGTFTRIPGLRRFHMGAFAAAAEAGVPLVPVSINGTRSILRDKSKFPRRGEIQITVGPPITAVGTDWAAAVRLRDTARAALLEHLGEPDLAHNGRHD
jgi:1-acyl-sn-glycerol-3-phosphate acyltransferase